MDNKTPNIYSKYYLIYTRKSTDDANNQKNSIGYQKSETLRFAEREHLPVAQIDIDGFCKGGIITERHTGFKEDDFFTIGKDGTIQLKVERPKFFRLIELLHQGAFKGVIFLCMDRASRNKTDNGILDKLRKRGIDFRFAQVTYENTSAGDLHMDIDQVFSGHYSRALKEKVRDTMAKLRDQGICTYRAPIGYINTGDPKVKPFDPKRAPIIKHLFDKYLNERMSLHDLARWANEQGLTMPPVRKPRTKEEMLEDEEVIHEPIARPVTFKNIHGVLTNPFYIGFIKDNDCRFIPSISHEALIDQKLFYQVQEALQRQNVSIHNLDKYELPYRGLLRCGLCNRSYTPYLKKGITYYRATCMPDCKNPKRNCNAAFIEESIGKVIQGLYFTEVELIEIDKKLATEIPALEKQRLMEIESIERQKSRIREDLAYLHSNKLMLFRTGSYTPEAFLEEETTLNKDLYELSIKVQSLDTALHEVIKDIVVLSRMLQEGYIWYYHAEPAEKERLIKKVFLELKLSGNILNYQCRNGFKVLENHSFLLGDPKTWVHELLPYHFTIKDTIGEFQNSGFC